MYSAIVYCGMQVKCIDPATPTTIIQCIKRRHFVALNIHLLYTMVYL